MNNITHVVLAGDRDYARYLLDGKPNKCLIEFSGKKLLSLTFAALGSASEVRRVIFVGPRNLQEKEGLIPDNLNGKPVIFLPQRRSLSENVLAASRVADKIWPGGLVVFLTNDAPLLTASELDSFAIAAAQSQVSVAIGVSKILDDQLCDPLVKQYIRSMVLTSDGLFLLANQIALRTAEPTLLKTLQKLFDVRKQSRWIPIIRTLLFALAHKPMRKGIRGWLRSVMAKRVWLLQRNTAFASRFGLSCAEIETRLTELLECESGIAIVRLSSGLGCFDADTVEQLTELRNLISTQNQSLRKLEVAHA
ncbi:MAG TPA: NTP transferase domain-containing protein [Pyrinomonadaceae bacterium]|nr:NTP transferase domain-containing protein [Pyrinomonadaceae bacterium]